MDSTYHSILSVFGVANPYAIKSWAGGIFTIFYLLLVLIVISALTASITSFLAARVEINFKIFDNVPVTTDQSPLELGGAVNSMPRGSFVVQQGSTTETYARTKLYVDTSVDEKGDPIKVQYLEKIAPTLGELDQMKAMIMNDKYLGFITYTPSLEAFMAQEEARARDFRMKNPNNLEDKRAKSDVCNQMWYLKRRISVRSKKLSVSELSSTVVKCKNLFFSNQWEAHSF